VLVLVGSCKASTVLSKNDFLRISQWILDVLICNWIGTYLGKCILMFAILLLIFFVNRNENLPIFRSQGLSFLVSLYQRNSLIPLIDSKPYEWRGLRQTRGLRSKARRVLSQFSPHDFTAFKWGTASSFTHFISVVLLLAVFLAAELNPFYLKVKSGILD